MGGLAAWLGSIAWPIVSRVLTALGVGYISYEGAQLAVRGAIDAAKANFDQLPIEVFMLVAKFGFFDFMSIVIGGAVSGMAFMALKKFTLRTAGV